MFKHQEIDKKWQKHWEFNKVFKTQYKSLKKFYALDMFPYPSAAGLHLGHPLGYTATDIISRLKRLQGYDVLHPMGWDAFGLPAEQYAIKTGNHPADFTAKNIENFRRQIKAFGFSYDWEKEIDTTDPAFYYHTQWIFKLLYKQNLAEIRETDVNWCQDLGTVLANEEIVQDENGNLVSERGGFPVTNKKMKQWVLKITNYADKLLEGLKDVDFPDSLKLLQEKWIGKSNGWEVKFFLEDQEDYIEVYTTRIETIFGVSFVAISTNHQLSSKLASQNPEIQKFIDQNFSTSNKLQTNKKTGIFTNLYLTHPILKTKIPVFISNYVLNNYGTGAIMGVPAHDSRDLDFAQVMDLKVIKVIDDQNLLINSDKYNGLTILQAREKIFLDLSTQNLINQKTSYKIKDWVFSRQRYWGEPFPVYFDENDNIFLEEKIVELPYMDKIKPNGDGQSPLASNKKWLTFSKDGQKYRRETNTMPQWAGSSWYYLAYILKNSDGSYLNLDSPQALERFKKWLPVDLYIGGQEHAVGHLIYSRFWHKVLYEAGIVNTHEPFFKIVNQGMLLGSDGSKMSKSKGNVINPDEILELYGADALRLFLMFMSPLTDVKNWKNSGIKSMYQWLERVYRVITTSYQYDAKLLKNITFEQTYHKFIAETTQSIEDLKFNVAISKLMVYINFLSKQSVLPDKKYLTSFIIIFSTFAPHLAEELLEKLDENDLFNQKWPEFDKKKTIDLDYNLPISINGKTRTVINLKNKTTEEEIIKIAKNNPALSKYLENAEIIKTIYVAKKMLNFITKEKK
ncbi:leucine--tRNA ligase [Mesomycoplasma conjunctivae]|uniref:leucine--tRNA ligase n=1 Tax=Mesomycoplasma conjunctivae TaxID=45361 RepID=UPI003DA2B778